MMACHSTLSVPPNCHLHLIIVLQDDESGIYAQPDVSGGSLPDSPQLYSQIEWREEFLGDIVFDKPPMILVSPLHYPVPHIMALQEPITH